MEKIVLLGSGGQCKVIIDIIKSIGIYEASCITDLDSSMWGKKLLGIPVIGSDDVLYDIYNEGIKNAFICIGAVGNISIRNRVYDKLKKIGFNLPVLVHKTAWVSPYASIGEGTCVMPGAIVNPGAEIGENCIINSGAVVEHDCIIKKNTHVSPGAHIAGGVKIGVNCHIGLGCNIIQCLNIGDNVVIGAGAVVTKDIPSCTTAVGIPAKVIKCR